MRNLWGILRSLLTYYALPGRQRRMQRLYRQFIQPGDLCFDIGAHVGNRLLAFRRLGAVVVGVEPQLAMNKILHILYGRSPHITLIAKAIGGQAGTIRLHVSSQFPTVTTVSSSWITAVQKDPAFTQVTWDKSLDVPMITLDDLIAEYGLPSFCKIDIEGYEYEALRGLSHPLPALSFEFIPAAVDIAHNCIDHLTALGPYEFNWSAGESHQLAGDWVSATTMHQIIANVKAGSGDIYGRMTQPTALMNDPRP